MSDRSPEATLLALRGSIDNIDAALIHMLAERFRCTQQVGELKAEHGMPAFGAWALYGLIPHCIVALGVGAVARRMR